MIILIDSGNSRLKAGWLDQTSAAAGREPRAVAFDNLDIKALGNWLSTLPQKPQRAVGVNVAGQQRGQVIAQELQSHGCQVQWISAQEQTLTLINGYQRPTQLGADRWASLLGVLTRQPVQHPPFILASFGTATTIDTIGPDNVFAGGLIVPGPAMMRQALAEGTANLPMAQGAAVLYPTDTDTAINSGIAAAQAGALARQWLAARNRYKQAPQLYVSGGGWPEVEHETRRLLHEVGAAMDETPEPLYIDRPVLDGLAQLALQLIPQASPGPDLEQRTSLCAYFFF